MRILILDDEDVRHEIFSKRYEGHDVTHVKKFSEFVRVYTSGPSWDLVHLDHDLGNFQTDREDPETYVDGWGCRMPYDGGHATRVICESVEKRRPQAVIVHSVNSVGAARMMIDLKQAGIPVRWEPFDATKNVSL